MSGGRPLASVIALFASAAPRSVSGLRRDSKGGGLAGGFPFRMFKGLDVLRQLVDAHADLLSHRAPASHGAFNLANDLGRARATYPKVCGHGKQALDRRLRGLRRPLKNPGFVLKTQGSQPAAIVDGK